MKKVFEKFYSYVSEYSNGKSDFEGIWFKENRLRLVYKTISDRPKIYTDFSEMLDEENLDAIDITTSTLSHHSIAISAMKNLNLKKKK